MIKKDTKATLVCDEIGGGEDLASLIKPHLNPSERLLWVGRPEPNRFRWRAWSQTVFGVIGTAFGLLVLGGMAFGMYTAQKNVPLYTWVWGVIPILVSYVLIREGILSISCYRRALDQAVYAITDERAITLKGFGCAGGCSLVVLESSGRSFFGDRVQDRRVKRHRKDGSGDIVLDCTFKRGRHGHFRVELGFFGVADVNRVDNLLGAIPSGNRPMKFDLEAPF